MNTRLCVKCGNEHTREHSYCHECFREYQREWRQRNPEAQRAAKRKWEAAHPDEVREAKRRRYQADLEKSREYQRKRRAENPEKFDAYKEKAQQRVRDLGGWAYYRHGITAEQRAAFVAAQNGKCPFCEKTLDEVKVSVDHDHETGMLRGLLCGTCNSRLGWYENRMDLVAAYLAGPHVTPAAPVTPQHRRRETRRAT